MNNRIDPFDITHGQLARSGVKHAPRKLDKVACLVATVATLFYATLLIGGIWCVIKIVQGAS